MQQNVDTSFRFCRTKAIGRTERELACRGSFWPERWLAQEYKCVDTEPTYLSDPVLLEMIALFRYLLTEIVRYVRTRLPCFDTFGLVQFDAPESVRHVADGSDPMERPVKETECLATVPSEWNVCPVGSTAVLLLLIPSGTTEQTGTSTSFPETSD